MLDWLSDDTRRSELYAAINAQRGGKLAFPSRAGPPPPCCPTDATRRPAPQTGHHNVDLVTCRDIITKALEDPGGEYSNRVYADLGGGNFLLALDRSDTGGETAHRLQLKALCEVMRGAGTEKIAPLALHACNSAAVLSLRTSNFDLAAFAEQVALRFCQSFFGYSLTDLALLEASIRAGYRALVYEVLGRHFVTDKLAIPEAQKLVAQLEIRTAALIDAYAAGDADDDVLKGCALSPELTELGFTRVLETLGRSAVELNGEQRAVVAIGSVAGTVGNVQAAVCIAVQAFFDDPSRWTKVRAFALSEPLNKASQQLEAWKQLILVALRRNPPIAFLPRLKIEQSGEEEVLTHWILALGGGTANPGRDGNADDSLIWGLPTGGKHWCSGRDLAWPLIVETVRFVMSLPGLAQRLDPLDATPLKLKKRWGFACESYPLSYRREGRYAHSCLNVAMRVKAPVLDNSARLREVIRAGAPRISELLRASRHVHFAWFEFTEGDAVLVLHTVYDGDFNAYIQHFALQLGDLFDALFQWIEDAPPMPVKKYPNDFVALIQRYNRAPAMNFFFSAYPSSEAAQIVRAAELLRAARDEARVVAAQSTQAGKP